MLQAVFARILQSADKFCRTFPCKTSEFSMFSKLFGCMHACILHVLSVRLSRVTSSVFTSVVLPLSVEPLRLIQQSLHFIESGGVATSSNEEHDPNRCFKIYFCGCSLIIQSAYLSVTYSNQTYFFWSNMIKAMI